MAKINNSIKIAPKQLTKSSIFSQIANGTGVTKKDIAAVFDSLSNIIKKNLSGKKAPGIFTLPGLVKIKVMKRAATRARKGTNPFNGKDMIIKAKPATKVVKVAPLKRLKDMI